MAIGNSYVQTALRTVSDANGLGLGHIVFTQYGLLIHQTRKQAETMENFQPFFSMTILGETVWPFVKGYGTGSSIARNLYW